MRKAVCIAAIQNRLLLLVRKGETWILPGGKPERHETNEACLIREVSEELPGCCVVDLQPLGMWEGRTPHMGDIIQCWIYIGTIEGPRTV